MGTAERQAEQDGPLLSDPASFTHWVRDTVRFCDQDDGGHVNNTAIAQYVESGRIAFLRELLAMRQPGERFIAAHLAIDFLKETHYPGDVQVGSRLLRIGTKSLTGGCGLFKDGICFATATWVVVFLRGAETAPVPDDMREKLTSKN